MWRALARVIRSKMWIFFNAAAAPGMVRPANHSIKTSSVVGVIESGRSWARTRALTAVRNSMAMP